MRKTRILAALLCIMMIVCSLPVLQVSAAEGDSYASIDEILGFTAYEIPSVGYEFNEDFVPGSEIGLYYRDPDVTGTVNYTADGMTFDSNETSTIWYTTNTKAENPFVPGTATVISMKFTNESDKITVQFNIPERGRMYTEITTNQIKTSGSKYVQEDTNEDGEMEDVLQTNQPYITSFDFGTDWFDFMYVPTETGIQVYVKNASTEGKWLFLQDILAERTGSTSGFMSLSASAGSDGAVVKSIAHYSGQKPTGIESIEEIAGVEELTNYGNSQVFTADYSNPIASCLTNANGDYGTVTYTDKGMVLPTDKTAIWYLSGTNAWLTENVTVVKAKFGSASDKFEFHFKCPGFDGTNNYFRGYIKVNPGQVTSNGVDVRPNIGTDWFELAVHAKADGHDIYLKNKSTENFWQLVAEVEGYTTKGPAAGDFCIAGVSVAENGVTVASVDCYKEVAGAKTVEEIMGVEEISNASCNHVFTADYSHPDAGCLSDANGTYGEVSYTANGMSFPSEKSAIWRLAPAGQIFSEKNAVVVRAKLGTANDAFDLQMRNPSYDKRAYVTVSANQVRATGYDPETDGNYGEAKSFEFGTEWFELLVLTTVDGHDVYVKNAGTSNRWQLLLEMNGYRAGSPASGQLCISGTASAEGNLLISSVSVYKEVKKYDNITALIGSNYSSTYAFNFDADSILPGNETAGFLKPEGVALEADGLTLKSVSDTSETNRYGALNFLPFDRWSPLNVSACYADDGTYIPQAFYMEMKGDGNFQLRGPSTTGGRVSVIVKVGEPVSVEIGSGAVSSSVIAADEWMEYLVVPNTDNWEAGYAVYVKGAIATEGKWIEVAKATEYNNPTNGYTKLGIQFTGLNGYVRKIRTYPLTQSVAEAKTVPAGADFGYFVEEFDAEPTYTNQSLSSAKIENGYLNSTATYESGQSKFNFHNVVIPVDGYIEFRVKNNGTRNFILYDGEQKFQIYLPYPYGTITNGTGYLGDSADIWRTWRVVRTSEGFSAYSKIEGDAGWYAAVVNVAGKADVTAPMFQIALAPSADGVSPSNGQVDYVRVYGPAPSEKLTITDGYSSRIVKNGDKITKPETFRILVGEENTKLVIGTYCDDILVSARVVDSNDLTNGEAIYNVSGANYVKVFLWKDTDNMKNVTEAIKLDM